MECSGDRFAVPWLDQGEWSHGVWLAHRIFGVLAIAVLLVWACLFLEALSLRRAFLLAGGATGACGLWLIGWVGWLIKPSVTFAEKCDFALRDLAQLQHLAMGLLLAAAGAAEVRFAQALLTLPRRRADALLWPHLLWGLCVGWVGLLFLGHPQVALEASPQPPRHRRSLSPAALPPQLDDDDAARHLKLGLGLLLGASLLALQKRRGLLDGEMALLDLPMLAAAALAFGVAALQLLTFPAPPVGTTANSTLPEPAASPLARPGPPLPRHIGATSSCGWLGRRAALCGVWLGAASLALSLCVAARKGVDWWRRRRRGPLSGNRGTACESEGIRAAADDSFCSSAESSPMRPRGAVCESRHK